jgi:hypothetical protein
VTDGSGVFTATEKTELWDRWKRGESLTAIGRSFGKQASSIYFQLSPYGGIRPAPRRRSHARLRVQLSTRFYLRPCFSHKEVHAQLERVTWREVNLRLSLTVIPAIPWHDNEHVAGLSCSAAIRE